MSKNRPHIVFRVDGGDVIGYGHIMRSVALAQEFQHRGAKITFFSRQIDGSGVKLIGDYGFEVEVIPTGASENLEAAWVKRVLRSDSRHVDLFVVDAYHLPAEHWKEFAEVAPVLGSDVFGGRDYTGLSFLYNAYAGAEKLDYSRVNGDCQLLLGSQYALLRKEVLEVFPDIRNVAERVTTVLVNGGGVDEHDVVGRVAEAFHELSHSFWPEKALFVTGKMYPFGEALDNKLKNLPFAERLVQPNNWVELLRDANLALIAGGSTQYEAAAFGTPYLTFLVEENQRSFAEGMEELGITEVAGWIETMDAIDICQKYEAIVVDSEKRAQFSRNGRNLLDGKGAERVVQACLNKLQIHSPKAVNY